MRTRIQFRKCAFSVCSTLPYRYLESD